MVRSATVSTLSSARRIPLSIPLSIVLSIGVPSTTTAHHAFSAFYDTDAIGEIQGTLTDVFWINPHAAFRVQIADGQIWEVETAPVNRLQRLGLDGSVGIGDQVTFVGALSRLGRNELLATNMILPSGTEVLLDPFFAGRLGLADRVAASSEPGDGGSTVVDGDPDARGIFRVWSRASSDRTSELPFTDATVAARDAWDPLIDDPALRCIPPGMPVVMDTPFPIQFEEGDGRIILRIEQWDGLRSIHMGTDVNPRAQPPNPMGYSIGRWEGRTLVVETTDISWPYIDEFGTPQSEAMNIVERFTLSEDERQLGWAGAATDPATFTEPADLGSMGYTWVPSEKIKPYDCSLAAGIE